jgi:predicted O-linked N-acetylglucosamine transferase (SPINDLY family)
MRFVIRWVSRWLDRRGLGHVADSVDRLNAAQGDVRSLHDMARRSMARQDCAQAVEHLQAALAISPEDAALWCSLGAAHRQGGEFDASRRAYEQALALKPDYPEVLSNLGEWHIAGGRSQDALQWLDQALQCAPGFFQARINKTAALFELGRFALARDMAEQLVRDEPESAEARLNLGNVLVQMGKARQGIKEYRKALELRPEYAEAHFNLSSLLGSKEDLAKAIGYLKRRLEERGDSVQNLGMLASAYHAMGQLQESEELSRRVLERQPDNLASLITLGSCLSSGGDSAAALALYEKVVALDPTQAAMGSNILFESNNLASLSRERMFAMHCEWAERFERPLLQSTDFADRSRAAHRPLRVGYVSGDFTRHPVGFLLRDILQHHDKQNFSIHCFSMVIRSEDVLPELRSAADSWDDIFYLSDDEVVARIREAQIDILVDLSGHTAFHRLLAFARRPAPVQVEWIGYFHSTGMAAMDYFITDPFTSPAHMGQLFSETPVCLPHTRFCYGPPAYAPEVGPLPFLKNGFLTFGSFNRLPKLTDAVVDAWSRILLAVPASRLVIKSSALSESLVRQRLLERFAQQGVAAERLELRQGSGHTEMLAEYGDIDLALDTFPFNGGMTTLEALWMGVPVLTIAGNTVVSRQTISALSNMGLEKELAFADPDQYVAAAVRLAAQAEQLSQWRQELRARMVASPLRDAKRFTADLEVLFRRMWQAWCAGEKLPSDVPS